MAKFIPELSKLSDSLVNTVKSIGKSPKAAWEQLSGRGATVAQESSGFGKAVGSMAFAPVKGAAKVGIWMVEQPFAWGAKGARWGINAIGGAYRKVPLLMVPATVIAAAMGIGSMARRRQMHQAMEAQAFVDAQQEGQSQAVAPQYQVTAEDMAAMNARMKGGNGPQAGHADAIAAARQSAAPAQTAAL